MMEAIEINMWIESFTLLMQSIMKVVKSERYTISQENHSGEK